jgi:hypothetical protein
MLKALVLIAAVSITLPVAAEEPPFPDMAERMLHCLHPTQQFRTVDVVETPWQRGPQYKADTSWLLRIVSADGISNHPYKTDIGLIRRGDFARMVVVDDTSPLAPSTHCSQWFTAPAVL